MQKINPNKRIYLSGGGNEHQSFPLDKFFFDSLKKGGNFLYIPVALRGHRFYSTVNSWMNNVLKLHDRNDLTFEVADDLSKYKLGHMKNFDAIYIGGGNTWSLLSEIKETGFSKVLIQCVEKGMPIYGGSAGAIVLGKRIDTHDDENKIGSTDISGFSELGNYSVTCHFDISDRQRFVDWSNKKSLSIICLTEETGLIIKGDDVTCVGEPCHIFGENSSYMKILSEEKFKI